MRKQTKKLVPTQHTVSKETITDSCLLNEKIRMKKLSANAEGKKMRFGKKTIAREVKRSAERKNKFKPNKAAAFASAAIHKQTEEYEEDNTGLQAANQADKKVETLWQSTAKNLSRWMQKQSIKKEYAAITSGKASAKTTAISSLRNSPTATDLKAFVKESKGIGSTAASSLRQYTPMLAMICFFLLVIILLFGSLSSCSMLFGGVGNSVVGTSFTATDEDILAVEEIYSSMEEELRKKIREIEEDNPDCDEYDVRTSEIGHNPYALTAFLTVLYGSYKKEEVEHTLEELFAAQYHYSAKHQVKVLSQTVTKDVLHARVTNYSLEKVIEDWDLTEPQRKRYHLLIQQKGNRAYLFSGNIYAISTEEVRYKVPGEALTNEKFAKMIYEAEKYLGYPYVWGGSSPTTSFDCSGFVCWVINHCGNGWNVGRKTAEGLRKTLAPVVPNEAKPGDLIFFQGTYDTIGASHVGIYVGNGMMIHCGSPIQYASINSDYFRRHFLSYGRLP